MKTPSIPTVGPPFFMQFADDLLRYIAKVRPISGIGTSVIDSPGGRPVNLRGGQGGAGSAETPRTHPFKTYLREKEGSPGEWEARVELGSNLYNGQGNWGNTPIVGLDEWFDVVENDYIYLTGTWYDEDGVLQDEIQKVDLDFGDSLPEDRIEIVQPDPEEPKKQARLTTRVARIVAIDPEADPKVLVVEQNLRSHLTLLPQCLEIQVLYPFPLS